MEDKEKVLTSLREQIDELRKIRSENKLKEWCSFNLSYISQLYGGEANIDYRRFRGLTYPNTKNVSEKKKDFEILLKSFIKTITDQGLPQTSRNTKAKTHSIHVENHNHVSQAQNIDIKISIEDIKKDFSKEDFEKIQEIVHSKDSKTSRLKKLGDFLKDTGVDVLSSTLAKIICQMMGV